MTAKAFVRRRQIVLPLSVAIAALVAASALTRSQAQSNKLVLISQETSTRAIAVDSVTLKREPFDTTSEVTWGNDARTRVMLFATGLARDASPSDISATAEDGSHKHYSLTVEYVGPVPEEDWATAVVVRLSDQMGDLGDVLIGLSYQGSNSNRVRVGIGHVGDGPPDDEGAVPTPGTTSPHVSPAATAGTLSTSVSHDGRAHNNTTSWRWTGTNPGPESAYRICRDRFGWNDCAGETRGNLEGRHGRLIQHTRQRIHVTDRRLHHSGTFSSGR